MGPTVIVARMVGGPGCQPAARSKEEDSQTFALGLHWAYVGRTRTRTRARTRTHEKIRFIIIIIKMCAVVCAVVCVVGCVASIGKTPVFIGISLCRAVCR